MTDESQSEERRQRVVLIVDDNPDNLKVLGDMLRNLGYAVRAARDGAQALQSMERAAPDIVLLDIHMPGMDGYEVCRRMRATPALADVPVIFLSALGETFNKVIAYQCGGNDYITKPFQIEEVDVRMRAHMRTSRLLAESQARFQSSFEQAAVGMAHLDLDGRFLRVNQHLCEMLGYNESELLGLSVLRDLTHERYRDSDAADLRALLAGQIGCASNEKEYVRKDGSCVWCRATLSLVRLVSTGDRYLTVIVEDISQRKQAEDERRRLATAIEQAAESVVITDAQGAIQYVNPATLQGAGYSREELVGAPLSLLAGDADGDSAFQEMRHAASSGHNWSGRIVSARKDGTCYSEDATVSPVRDATGAIVNYVIVSRDITEQISMENRLRQAQKMEAIGTLAGGIAHDFNNILSAIIGFTDLAIDDVPEGSQVRQDLEQVLNAGHRARDLVAQILAFSRQTDREIIPVRVQSVTKEAIKLLRGSIPSSINISQEIDTECLPVLADPTSIHQIIMNLCTNAYHAMREKGNVITVRLSQVTIGEMEARRDPELSPGDYIRLEVHDEGHGMDAATQSRIFEPYFTTKERGEGTGLGLAIIHGIVKDLNGVIHVYSEVGQGSTFTILLPTIAGNVDNVEKKRSSVEELTGNERILLVDDEEPIVSFAREALSRLGYQVTVLLNGTDALNAVRAAPDAFDVVITDQMMPVMKGTELSHRIHEVRPDLPIILCSGFCEDLRDARSKEKNISSHVMKPIIGADLAKAVRGVLDEKKA